MVKQLRDFVAEVARPISGAEINFLDKHTIITFDYPVHGTEDQFTGGDIHKFTRLADYKPGQDKAVYEGVIALNGDEEINKAEKERHKTQEILKQVIDENSEEIIESLGIDADMAAEISEVLKGLSEENLQYAKDNNINLIEFAYKLIQ